jgi:exonuclease VII large subunit
MALGQRIAQNLLGQLQTRIFEFQSLNQQIVNGLQKKYQFEVKAFQQCTLVLGNGFRKKISEAKEEFSLTEQMVMASNPIAILSKGYARVFQKKLIIHSAKEARADAELNLQFLDGMISAKVNAINNYDLPASN